MSERINRLWRFLQAYFLLIGIHRSLRLGGFDEAQRRFLRPWKARSLAVQPQDAPVPDIARAVQQASLLQWQDSQCLHRALAAYALLRAAGAQPRFVMATRSQPFAAHAWTELSGQAVADDDMQVMLHYYTPLFSVPPAGAG